MPEFIYIFWYLNNSPRNSNVYMSKVNWFPFQQTSLPIGTHKLSFNTIHWIKCCLCAREFVFVSQLRGLKSLFSTWLDPVVLYRVTNWWCHFAFNLSLFAFNPPRSRALTHFAIKTEWVEISRQITDITRKCEQSRRLFVKHWIHHMFVVCLFQLSHRAKLLLLLFESRRLS